MFDASGTWRGTSGSAHSFSTTFSLDQNAELFITASGTRPLSIFSPQNAPEGALLRLLSSNSIRVKDLDVELTATGELADILAHPFPILESLRTHFVALDDAPGGLQLRRTGDSCFPRLTHLSLDSLVKSLSLTLPDLHLMLANMPNLEFLHITLPQGYKLPPGVSSSTPNPSPDPSIPRPLSKLRTFSLRYISSEPAVAIYRALELSPAVTIRLSSVSFSAPPALSGLLPAPFSLEGFTDLTWAVMDGRLWLAGEGGERGALRLTGEWNADDEDAWLPWVEAPHAWLPGQTLRNMTLSLEWDDIDLAGLLMCTPMLVALTAARHPQGPSTPWCGIVSEVCGALARAECCPRLAELTICASDLAVGVPAAVAAHVLGMARARDGAGQRLAKLTLDMDGPLSAAVKIEYLPLKDYVGVLAFSGDGGEARFRPALDRWWAMNEGLPWTIVRDPSDLEHLCYPWYR